MDVAITNTPEGWWPTQNVDPPPFEITGSTQRYVSCSVRFALIERVILSLSLSSASRNIALVTNSGTEIIISTLSESNRI